MKTQLTAGRGGLGLESPSTWESGQEGPQAFKASSTMQPDPLKKQTKQHKLSGPVPGTA